MNDEHVDAVQRLTERVSENRIASVLGIAAALASLSPQERAQRLDGPRTRHIRLLARAPKQRERQHRKARRKIANRNRRVNRGRR